MVKRVLFCLFTVAVIIVIIMAVKDRKSIVSPIEYFNSDKVEEGVQEIDHFNTQAGEVTSEDLIMDMIGIDTLPESSVQPIISGD